LLHIGNTEIFHFIIMQPTPEPEIRIICLSLRKLMSVVKDVDLEAMPTSIFLNDYIVSISNDYIVSYFSMMMMMMMMIMTPVSVGATTVCGNMGQGNYGLHHLFPSTNC